MSAPEPPPSTGYPPQDQQPGTQGQQPGSYPPQQPGAYPPQQPGAYPPQQPGAYPPQQPGAYPPQQPPAYPPQDPGAYPPQQPGAYPPGAYPPQPGYPAEAYPPAGYPPQYPAGYPQQSAPPPYDYKQDPMTGAQQQASTNVVVVQQQPRAHVVYQRHYGTGDHYALMSILLTITCAFCCYWPALFCTIPAIIFATSAQEADARGDLQTARSNGNIALGLNIAAIGTYVAWWIIIIISISTSY